MNKDKRAKRAKQKAKAANVINKGYLHQMNYEIKSPITTITPSNTQTRPPKFNPDGTRVDHLAVQKLKDYGLWEQMQRQSYANQNSQLIADDGCIFFWICNENGHSGYSWFHNVAAKEIIISRGE